MDSNPLVVELNDAGDRIEIHNALWMHKPLVAQIPGKAWARALTS